MPWMSYIIEIFNPIVAERRTYALHSSTGEKQPHHPLLVMNQVILGGVDPAVNGPGSLPNGRSPPPCLLRVIH